jgi:hypothetical protein
MIRYMDGKEIQKGDKIRYQGELGEVEFVVLERTGKADIDWYLEEYKQPGFMIKTDRFGRVFLTQDDVDESLQLPGAPPNPAFGLGG